MQNPILLQANVRFWLEELSQKLDRQATLEDIPDLMFRQIADRGFDWLYLLCMWKTGEMEAQIARSEPDLKREAERLLGYSGDDAICASCFAISGYEVPEIWGGLESLGQLKERMHQHGLRLMLDFIPNHTGVSHPWVKSHPDFYLEADPGTASVDGAAIQVQSFDGVHHLMHGRDPYFPPWSDTLQLNYANPDLQAAQREELLHTARYCDGLRCDMAMLIIPEVYKRTWRKDITPFWPHALAAVRDLIPGFVFLAESYWDLEAVLIEQGFDFAYDKQLYDAFKAQDASRVNQQIVSKAALQPHLAHFMENHDEPRAASVFPTKVHEASALISYFLPGLRFFFEGQHEGKALKTPIQFCTSPKQIKNEALSGFYSKLMDLIVEISGQDGECIPLSAIPAWKDDQGWRNFVAFAWNMGFGKQWLIVVNYSDRASQCFLRSPFQYETETSLQLFDRLNNQTFLRSADELEREGLYIDLPAWGCHCFEFKPKT